MGGGGLQVHNHATSWPNLQDGTCKNSIQFEFQVGPECGKKGAFTRHAATLFTFLRRLPLQYQISVPYVV